MRILRDLRWVILSYALFLAGHEAWSALERSLLPVCPGAPAVHVLIPKGTGLMQIASTLKEKGVISSRHAFFLLALWQGDASSLKAGEYMISPGSHTREILQDLVSGNVLKHMVTIPEGYTMFDIATLLEEVGLASKDSFLSAARDRVLLDSLGISGNSAEGYLFPDTYFFTRDVSTRDMVTSMVRRFRSVWKAEGFDERTGEKGVRPEDAVTIASIVEKEAAMAEERPIIAGVFWNRLGKGMPLQADPTVIYGILAEKNEAPVKLTRELLQKETPFNTYTLKGLPRGPISNPGLSSLRASIYPADTSYLYFVSNGNGSHHFSASLEEHNRAVERYIKKPGRKEGKASERQEIVESAPYSAPPTENMEETSSEGSQ